MEVKINMLNGYVYKWKYPFRTIGQGGKKKDQVKYKVERRKKWRQSKSE